MKKKYIVKSAQQFNKIIKDGITIKSNYYVIYCVNNDLEYDRFGISVGKKIGNAVFRNKYKRKLRSIIDNYKKNYINHKDYIIILRREAINVSYIELLDDFFRLMDKLTRKGKCE